MKAFCFALSLLSAAPVFAATHVWQESAAVSVKLGVRDKFAGERDVSEITFRVTDESRHVFELKRRTKADEFLYVTFPDDFTDGGGVGRYTWQALSDGHVIAGGKFSSEY